MPFRRRRKRRRRRRRRGGRGMSTRAIALKALRSSDQEKKFVDFNFDVFEVVQVGSSNSIVSLNTIAEGSSNQQRIGRKALMLSLYLQLQVVVDAASTFVNTIVRMVVLWDKQPNGALPTWANVLNLPGTGNNAVEMLAPNNLSNSKRFDTLIDKRWNFHKDFIEGFHYKKYIRLNRTTQYNGAAAAVGTIATGNLVILFAGPIVVAGATPDVIGTARLRFVG